MELDIANLIKSRGMTQASVAEEVEISRGYMSDLVAGKKQPSHEVLMKLAEVLDAKVWQLFGEDAKPDTIAGFSDQPSVEFIHDANKSDTRALARALARALSIEVEHPQLFKAKQAMPAFMINENDTLIGDLNGKAADGDLVIATVVNEVEATANTFVLRQASPWFFLPEVGAEPLKESNSVSISILAPLRAVTRSA